MNRWRWVGGITLLVAVALLARWCSSGDAGAPGAEPSATLTPRATASPQATPDEARLVPLAEIDVPDGCLLFSDILISPEYGTAIRAADQLDVRLRATGCGMTAFSSIDENDQLVLEWRSEDDPTLTAEVTLRYDAGVNEWVGTTRFTEPGVWVAGETTGSARQVLVEWGDYGTQPTMYWNLEGIPRHLWVLTGDGEWERRWTAARSGLAWLRDPDRVVFVQQRGGTNVLMLGDVEGDSIEPLFEVGSLENELRVGLSGAFDPLDQNLAASIEGAPDGRAAVVWWKDGVHVQSRLISASGRVSVLELGTPRMTSFAWSPTSELLLALTNDELLALSPGGGVRARRSLETLPQPTVLWAPDGSYALAVYSQGPMSRIERFDPRTLAFETVFDGDVRLTGDGAASISSDGRLALSWWNSDVGGAVTIGVVGTDALVGAEPLTHAIGTIETNGAASDFGGLSWSPIGDSVAFAGAGLVLTEGLAPALSAVGLIEVASGKVRELAVSEGRYTADHDGLIWAMDGAVILARWQPCLNCPSTAQNWDAVDVRAGELVGEIEVWAGTGVGWPLGTTLSLNGLEVLDSAGETLGALDPADARLLGVTHARSADGDRIVAPLSPGAGTHLYATGGDAHELTALGNFDAKVEIVSMLGTEYAVVRGDEGWVRVTLADGAETPYVASEIGGEGAAFAAAPSGRLALSMDDGGFTLLDAAAPESEVLTGRQAWPDGLGERRGAISWSADESRIVLAGTEAVAVIDVGSGTAAVYPVDSTDVGLNPNDQSGQPLVASWGVDGTSVLFATREALWQLDVETGQASLIASAPRPGGFTSGTVLSAAPDGSAMAVGTAFGLFVPETGGEWRLVSRIGMPAIGGELYWSEDASRLAYAGATASGRPYGVVEVAVAEGQPRLITFGVVAQQVLGWLEGGRIAYVYRVKAE